MYSEIKLYLSQIDDLPLSPILLLKHYLASVEVFEFTLEKKTRVYFVSSEPTYYMCAQAYDNSCRISHINPEPISYFIPPGAHKIMIITFKYHWMTYKLQQIDQEDAAFLSLPGQGGTVQLPLVNMAGLIFRSFSKMSSANSGWKQDEIGYSFINGCITKYYNRLIATNKTKIFHAQKAAKVKHFIDENFHHSVAHDVPKLAEQFRLSERTLVRIAKLAFGVPLHEHVIKLRIKAGLDELAATNKPIYEIARQSGYNDAHYFSRAFKKHYGFSPKFVPRPDTQHAVIEMKG